MLKSRTTRLFQIALLIAITAAALRLVYIVRGRREPGVLRSAAPVATPLNREAYVVPRRLHSYDLQSAHELTRQPEWVKEGFRYAVYPYDPARRLADFQHEAGKLLPLQEIRVTDVLTQPTPGGAGQRRVLAVFDSRGREYAVPVGYVVNGDYQIYADEMFFYEDPRQLFNFWPADVWKAIEEHRVEKGMNEWQAAFAIGMAQPLPSTDPNVRILKYPNGDRPLVVTFRDGQVIEVKPAP